MSKKMNTNDSIDEKSITKKIFPKINNREKNIHPLDEFITTIEDNSNHQLEEIESPH